VKWNDNISVEYYVRSSITVHSSWPGWIGEDVSQYNNVSLATNPNWTRTFVQSNAVLEFNIEPLDPGLCGRANFNWLSNNRLYYGIANLNSGKSYGGRNGVVGDCDFDHNILHEMGHTQALGHTGISGQIMTGSSGGSSVDTLQSEDVAGLRGIY
jgi:hypothetical protein